MTVKITAEVVGLNELQKALEDLGSEVAGQKGGLVKNAMAAAARDVKKRQQAGAPQSEKGSHIDWTYSKSGKLVHGGESGRRAEPGRLKRSIRHMRRNPKYLNELFVVGPLLGKSRNDPNGAWYAAIVEFKGGEGGRGRGFMRRSIKPSKDVGKIRKNLARGIERVAKKVGNENAAKVGARIKKL